MESEIAEILTACEPRRINRGVTFDVCGIGWRCSVEFGIPVIMVDSFGFSPSDALNKLLPEVKRRLKID